METDAIYDVKQFTFYKNFNFIWKIIVFYIIIIITTIDIGDNKTVLRNFYKKQAKLHKEDSLHVVFSLLQKEEEKHSEILRNYKDKIELPLTDSNILLEVESIFKNNKDFHSYIKNELSQLEVYRKALEKEEESVKLYNALFDKSEEEQSKNIFQYLINQEKKHCIILEELVKQVSRPEEWVESAEFGLREEY